MKKIKNNFFLDNNGAGLKDKDKDLVEKISIKAYIVEPCKCIECCEASPKQGEIMSLSDKLIEYLYRESQRNFRKAKLELATAEQSFEDMKKIVKRKKINFFLVLL